MENSLIEFRDTVPMIELFSNIKRETNILFDFGDSVRLLKYEGGEFHALDPDVYSWNRYTNVLAFPESYFNTLMDEEKTSPTPQKTIKPVEKKLQANILGTHMLNFDFDNEFKMYLPSSNAQDIFLTIALKYRNGDIEKTEKLPIITMQPDLVEKKLREITRPKYFEEVVAPFLTSKSTRFKIPTGYQPWYKFLYSKKDYVQKRMEELPKEINVGDFLYVGCKEQVSLQGFVKRNDKLSDYKEKWNCGLSTKPFMYFSNNYLEFISKHDAEMPKFTGTGPVNVAQYRTYDIPELGGKHFVFPQIGRNFDCKNSLFTGHPDLITGNIDEAMAHFTKTDFAEFADVVEKYANNMSFIDPSLEHIKNGSPYFH